MAKNKLIVRPKVPKGEDGYQTFSIRMKDSLKARIEALSEETGRSRNELIILFIEYAINHCEVEKN